MPANPEAFLLLEAMPFEVGLRTDFSDDLPESMSFALGLDQRLGLAVQIGKESTRAALARAYAQGGMLSTPLGEGSFGETRLQALFEPMLEMVGAPSGKSFLEIGCGTGVAMEVLARKGARVTGCEIGPQAWLAAQRARARVIEHPFFSGLFTERFDCVYALSVVEHIESVLEFVRDARNVLRPGGTFYASLQNAQPFFETGDPTVLVHEHWNYFTPASAERLLRLAGFVSVESRVLSEWGEICFWGNVPREEAAVPPSLSREELSRLRKNLTVYSEKVRHHLASMRRFMARLHGEKKSLVLYAGGSLYASCGASGQSFRFIDGDCAKHGLRWRKGLPPIEPPGALLTQPADVVLICSRAHASAIRGYLSEDLKVAPRTRVVTSDEVVSAGFHG